VTFGVLVVMTWRGLVPVELHLAGGVLLLATTFGLVLATRAESAERVVSVAEAHT